LRHYRNEYLKSFFVVFMFLYMSPVLCLLQFTHSLKAALAIWCFEYTVLEIFSPCPEKQFAVKFSTVLNIFFSHSGFLSILRLP